MYTYFFPPETMVFLTDSGLDGFTMRSRYDALKNSPPGDGGTVGMTGKYDWDIYRMGQNGGDLEHFF